MKKLFLGIIAALLVFVQITGTAKADAPVPSVTIDSIGGVTPIAGALTLNLATLPTTVNIVGTAAINQSTLDGASLTLSENGTTFYGPTNYWAGLGNVQTAGFTVPWTINAGLNQRTIVATISHDNQDGTSTVDVTLNLNVTVNQCPAAPSIATHFLQELKIKSGSTLYKNVISLVAQHMGPGTDFNGISACNSAAYAAEVQNFVLLNLAVSK